jgi:hypothetical protein
VKILYKQLNQLDFMESVKKYLIQKSDARLIKCCCCLLEEGGRRGGREEEDY